MKQENGIHTEQIQLKRDGKDNNERHDTKFFTIKKNDTKLN